jgi:hypothetical protein
VHSCTLAETPRPPPPPIPSHLSSYTRALLVSQDRRHLFATPGGSHFAHGKGRGGTQIIRQNRNSCTGTLYTTVHSLYDSYLLITRLQVWQGTELLHCCRRLLLDVDLDVFDEDHLLAEGFAAVWAGEGSLPRVDALMPRQVSTLPEIHEIFVEHFRHKTTTILSSVVDSEYLNPDPDPTY